MAGFTLEYVRSVITPDKHGLDDDAVMQPQLVSDCVDAYALAKDAKRRAKLAMEELYATIDTEMRQGDKLPETQIKMRIVQDQRMRKAERVLLDAELHEDQWWGALEKIKAKGYAVNFLGELYQSQYFVTEAVGKTRGNAIDGRANKAREMRSRGREED